MDTDGIGEGDAKTSGEQSQSVRQRVGVVIVTSFCQLWQDKHSL